MTWCSELSATPGLALARSAIRCRFVDRFAGLRAPSRVSRQRFSTPHSSLPSDGSRGARFPAVASTMKALRLPTPHPGRFWFATGFRAALRGFVLAEALPGGWRSRPGLGRLVRRRPGSGWRPRGRGGISQVPRRSIPCLCPARRPRPNQWSLTKAVPPMLPSHPTRRRLQRSHDLEAATGLWHPLPTLRTRRCRRPRKARFRLAGWPLPGEGRTLRIASKGFKAFSRHPHFQGLPCRKLGACRALGAQARHLHGSPAQDAAVPASADLGVLPRPQSLPTRADPATKERTTRAV